MSSNIQFSLLAIICVIVTSSVSTAIPSWVTVVLSTRGETIHEHAGLWKVCLEVRGKSACSSRTDVKDFMNATRALMITGIILFGISLLLAIKFAADESSSKSANTCIILLVLGGVLLIAAMLVFGHNNDVPNASYSSAFYLPIFSAIFAVAAAGFAYKAKRAHGYAAIGKIINQTKNCTRALENDI